MVFYLFVENGEGTFNFVNLDGVFSLFFVEWLEQFSHDFSNTGLYFIPFELSYLFGVLGGLLVIHVYRFYYVEDRLMTLLVLRLTK